MKECGLGAELGVGLELILLFRVKSNHINLFGKNKGKTEGYS